MTAPSLSTIGGRASAIMHLLCDPGCEGRCNDCPENVVRDLLRECERLEAEKAAAAEKLNERFHAGTRVTNCVSHSGLPFDRRPRACDLCAADIQNHLAFAIRVNEFLNAKVDAARAALAQNDRAEKVE